MKALARNALNALGAALVAVLFYGSAIALGWLLYRGTR
jgi:hypothetical protein